MTDSAATSPTPPVPTFTRENAIFLLGEFAPEQRVAFLTEWANKSDERRFACGWLVVNRDNTRNRFAQSLLNGVRRYGAPTDSQAAAAARAYMEDLERVARRVAEREAGNLHPFSPVEGEHTVRATISRAQLRVNRQALYGTTMKMTVTVTEGQWTGNRLWLTVPKGVREAVASDDCRDFAGVSVELTGVIERSSDDPHFGFMKRPKGTVIA